MSFGQAIKHVFQNYANFQGRASRSEFWWFYLFMVIVNAILAIPYQIGIMSTANTVTVDEATGVVTSGGLSGLAIFGIALLTIWTLATIIPLIAVSVRRLHDTDRSGGWWWLNLLCCIGGIILIIFYIQPSTPGPNRFGEGPATA